VKRHEGGLERKKSKKTSDRELGKDVDDGKIVAFEEVKKDINALTKEQQMEVVMRYNYQEVLFFSKLSFLLFIIFD